jgi:hypothetical protein
VFSGDWIPDHELARLGGLAIDPGTRGPVVDLAQRTSTRGVFAAGNVLHAAQMADQAALCGRHVAGSVLSYLSGGKWRDAATEIGCESPVRWVSPNLIEHGSRLRVPHGAFILRVEEVLERPRLVAEQDGRILWSKAFRRLRPALPGYASAAWGGNVRPGGGPVTFAVR